MSEKPFNVSDKRHFTPDGRPRDTDLPERPADRVPRDDSAPGEAGTAGPSLSSGERGGSGPAEFGPFLLSLGAQAGMLLSSPQEKGANLDQALDGARAIISILEMLQNKTEGRRTEEEDRILEGLLFELRMAYVERTRARTP